MKTYFNKTLSLFFILGFLFIPLTFTGLSFQYWLTRFLFLKPVAFLQSYLFPNAIKHIDFSSDTIGLNLLLCLLLLSAFIVVLLLNIFKVKSGKIISVFKSLSAYYIAFILLKYGFDKVFKLQFYLPEPNILYSNFGSLTKDILFWSTIGLSQSYSVVTGNVEVLTAVLILIKPTRILGFCIAIGVLMNILLINFSFDISVKTFTTFLLAVSVFNVYPYFKTIYAFFVQRKQVQLTADGQPVITANKWVKLALGGCLIGFVLYPYLQSGNFNDDLAERPFLHGAYNISGFIIGNDTLGSSGFPYKRLFIHRNNYLIFQQQDDKMVDYFFDPDPAKQTLELQDYHNHKIMVAYHYDEKTGVLKLAFNNKQKWQIEAKALNWKALPALQDGMHLTIDEIR